MWPLDRQEVGDIIIVAAKISLRWLFHWESVTDLCIFGGWEGLHVLPAGYTVIADATTIPKKKKKTNGT